MNLYQTLKNPSKKHPIPRPILSKINQIPYQILEKAVKNQFHSQNHTDSDNDNGNGSDDDTDNDSDNNINNNSNSNRNNK